MEKLNDVTFYHHSFQRKAFISLEINLMEKLTKYYENTTLTINHEIDFTSSIKINFYKI